MKIYKVYINGDDGEELDSYWFNEENAKKRVEKIKTYMSSFYYIFIDINEYEVSDNIEGKVIQEFLLN